MLVNSSTLQYIAVKYSTVHYCSTVQYLEGHHDVGDGELGHLLGGGAEQDPLALHHPAGARVLGVTVWTQASHYVEMFPLCH